MTLSDLTEILNSIESTSDAISTTRELILRFAMMGRISKPHVGDIPVSGLLSTIEDEKAQRGITKSKRHSKTKSEITSEEKACSIPDHWIWIRLGEIAQHNAGKTLDKGRNSGELRNYITTSNLYWGYFQIDQVKQMLIRDNELERCRATKGDLLICEGGEAGRAAVWPFDYDIAFQNHIHRARFYGGIDPHYVQLVFEKLNLVGDINRFRKGVGISNMSGKSLASIPIPLPPLAEQKRIVAKVDELMALCDQLEAQQQERDKQHAALARASLARFANDPTPDNLQFLFHRSYDIDPEDLRKSILRLAVRGKLVPQDESINAPIINDGSLSDSRFDIPNNWTWAQIDDLQPEFQNGASSRGDKDGEPVVVLRLADIKNRNITLDAPRKIAISPNQIDKYGLQLGDILITRVNGSADIVGSFIPVQEDISAIYCDHFIRMRIDKELMEPGYMTLAGESQLIRDQIRSLFITTAGQKTVNQGHIRSLQIPLPPLAEQRRIVAKVDQLMALVDELETQLASSREVAKNLLEALVAELTAA